VSAGDHGPARRADHARNGLTARRRHLLDLDAAALRRARRRVGLRHRRVLRSTVVDVTAGAADAVIRGDRRPPLPQGPLGDAPYDLVIADLLYTQLVYPALLDGGTPTRRIAEILRTERQRLTDAVVERIRASAPRGRIVHLNDVLGWWVGRDRPVALAARARHRLRGDWPRSRPPSTRRPFSMWGRAAGRRARGHRARRQGAPSWWDARTRSRRPWPRT
jgi:hypothetical protein